MNKLFTILICLCTSVAAYDKANHQTGQLWERAHSLYNKGAVSDALAVYEMINPKVSAVWFNMGNCYAVLENRTQALLCWSRARGGASYNQLKRIDESIGALIKKEDTSFSLSRFEKCTHLYMRCFEPWNPLYLQLIVLCAWYTFMVLGLIVPHKKRKRVLRMVCGTIIIFSMSGLWVHRSQAVPKAMVMNDNTSLYVGPCEDYHAIGLLMPGTVVVVKEEKDGWYKIKAREKNGWVRTKDVCMV